MTYSTPMKGIGLSAAAAALLAFTPVASALDVEISGHVNRMIRAADNGGEPVAGGNAGSDVQHFDNGADQSRVRLTGSQDVDKGSFFGRSTVGFDTEMRIADTSECYDIKQPINFFGGCSNSTDTASVEFSRADIFFDANWGKLSIGKGDSATRGADRSDLSGTDLILNYDPRRNSAIEFMAGGGLAGTGTTWGTTFASYEGNRSQNRIRYDSPVWSGLQLSISNASGSSSGFGSFAEDKYAFGATYASGSDNDSLQVRGAFGFTKLDVSGPNTVESLTALSGSVLFGGGWSITGNYGSTGTTSGSTIEEQTNWSVKGGYMFRKVAVAVNYMVGNDVGGVLDDDATSFGIAAQTPITDWLDVYASYQQATLEVGGIDSEDLDILTIGTKVAF